MSVDASGPYELVIDESKDNKTLLYAEIKIEASNGDITLKRVAGKTAHLATGGGRLAMDALQVAAGKVHSGGGSITIGQVRLSAAGSTIGSQSSSDFDTA